MSVPVLWMLGPEYALSGGLCEGSRPRGSLRWLGSRLRSRRGLVVLALVWFGSWLVLNGSVLIRTRAESDFCSDARSQDILRRLCLDFSSGLISGDLCLDLCVLKMVHYRRCLYYEDGKKVLEVQWRDRTVVLKSKHENFSSFEPLSVLQDLNRDEDQSQDQGQDLDHDQAHDQDQSQDRDQDRDQDQDQGEPKDLSLLDLVYLALTEVRSSLGLLGTEEEDSDGLSNGSLWRIWDQTLDRNRTFSRAELQSLWALLQQEEYSFLRLLQDLSPHVAQVLGSCGHFYAVEFVSAGHAWDQDLFSLSLDRSLQVPLPTAAPAALPLAPGDRGRGLRIALSFMDLIQGFENDFSHRLHLCDVKPENFGIREDLTVVAIDVDMAFFEPRLRSLLEMNCSRDDDCSFFDCWSDCDPKTGQCSPYRSNSNLQVVCEKIFRPWFSPSRLGAEGQRPLQVELQRAVQECSETHIDQQPEQGRDPGPDQEHRPGNEDLHLGHQHLVHKRLVHQRLMHQRIVHKRLVHVLTRLAEEEGNASQEPWVGS